MAQNTKQQQQNKGKPLTGAFELQTKIRVIIQDVMSATVRKVSQFHQKIENYETFFFTYKQRINQIEERSRNNEENICKINDLINKNKLSAQSQAIKLQQTIEKMKIQKNQQDTHIKDINKKVSTLTRQTQNVNNDLSRTKSKFIQVTDQMSAMKQDVTWKISKYVEETADTNTKIKLYSQDIKKQYYNVCLGLQKNKERYDQIIAQRDNQQNFNKRIEQQIDDFRVDLGDEKLTLKKLNNKLEQMDTALYSKIKSTQAKLQGRLINLQQSNVKLIESVKKVETFSDLLQQIRQDSQKIRRQLLKKFEQFNNKTKDTIEHEILGINKTILQYEKNVDKKVKHLGETQEKSMDFITQKLQYVKLQIQTEISSKATSLLQEKSNSQNGVNSIVIQQMSDKINKLSLETSKAVIKIQNTVKEVKRQVDHKIQETKEHIQDKVDHSMKIVQESVKGGIDPQFLQSIHKKIEDIVDKVQYKIFQMNKDIGEQNLRILKVEKIKQQTLTQLAQMKQSNTKILEDLDEKVTNKAEKVMFIVTKMRGDAIIKNQFIQKQMKDMKKSNQKALKNIEATNKLIPAIGQCLNLIMCLIYDAEYQHSRIIQDNLGSINNTVKFQNLIQGVLYEFSDKKKAGSIIYRHKQYKKIQIVRNTFEAYTKIWEDLFQNFYKQKVEMIPKNFYKNQVQKIINKSSKTGNSPRKQAGTSLHLGQKDQFSQKQIRNKKQQSLKNLQDPRSENEDPLNTSITNNKSFQIRKKKNNLVKSKDEMMIMVVTESDAQKKR